AHVVRGRDSRELCEELRLRRRRRRGTAGRLLSPAVGAAGRDAWRCPKVLKSRYFVEAVVHSGPADRRDALVQTPLNPQNLLWHAGNSGRFDARSLEVCEVDGERLAPVPCQIEGEVVTWIAP